MEQKDREYQGAGSPGHWPGPENTLWTLGLGQESAPELPENENLVAHVGGQPLLSFGALQNVEQFVDSTKIYWVPVICQAFFSGGGNKTKTPALKELTFSWGETSNTEK